MNPEEEIIGKRRRHTNAGNELVLTFGASANFRRIYTNIRRVYANSSVFTLILSVLVQIAKYVLVFIFVFLQVCKGDTQENALPRK